MFIYRHPGEAGGAGAGAATGEAGGAGAETGGKETPNTGAGAEEGKAGGAEEKGGTPKSAASSENMTAEQRLEALSKENAELKEKYEGIAKKLGKQSEHIGVLKQFTEGITKDPKGMLKKLAEQHRVDIKFADEAQKPDMLNVLQSGTAEEQSKALEQMLAAQKADLQESFAPILNNIVESQVAMKYPDWDDLADERGALNLGMTTGKLTQHEVLHYAARGMNLATAIEDAKKAGVAEYLAELQAKKQEQIDARGGGTTKKGGGEGPAKFEEVVAELAKITG